MPRFVVSVKRNAIFSEVLDSIKKASPEISIIGNPRENKTSKLTSGLILIECPETITKTVENMEGVKFLEPEVLFYPRSS